MTTINDGLGLGDVGADINDPSNVRQGGAKELSKDDFMKIFLKQMSMQDPMKPFDSAQMLQQMSTLTSLTASQELQKSIQNLQVNMATSQVVSASQMIGKKVQVLSGVSELKEGAGLSGAAIMPGEVSGATITIKKDGKVVKTIEKGSSGAGVLDFSWDGKDEEGNTMEPGFYQISATAKLDGKTVPVHTTGTFNISSVAMDPRNGSLILNVDGLGGIGMENVIKIL